MAEEAVSKNFIEQEIEKDLLKAILPTGIMPRRKDIPVLPSLPSTSPCK